MIASDNVIQNDMTTPNRIMAHSVHDIAYKLAAQEVPNNTCNAISFGSWNREISTDEKCARKTPKS